jgi:parallel beta-helix repeat protein
MLLSAGADPTGSRDSSWAFQMAIDSGQPVNVPAGRYRIATPLRLRTGTTLFALPGTAILVADPTNTAPGGALILIGTSVSNVSVKGLTFDGNLGSIHDNHKRVIYVNGGDHVVFDAGRWQNSAGPGLVFSGVAGRPVTSSGVRNSTFTDIGRAWAGRQDAQLRESASAVVFSNGSATTNVDNFAIANSFTAIGADAVDAHSQGRFRASGNRIDLGEAGWRPTTRATAVTFGVAGFYIYHSSDDVQITNNQIDGATGNCLDIAGATRILVTENAIRNCGGAGIALANTNGFTITSNTIINTNKSIFYEVENRSHAGGISFSCGRAGCSGLVMNGVVRDNLLDDDQHVRTQHHPIWQQSGIDLRNVQFFGNHTSRGQMLPAPTVEQPKH